MTTTRSTGCFRDGRPGHPLNDRSLVDHYQIISSVPPWLARRATRSNTSATHGMDLRRDVTVTAPTAAQQRRWRYVRWQIVANTSSTTRRRSTQMGTGRCRYGDRPERFRPGELIATDHIVTVSAGARAKLIEIARTVHQVAGGAGAQLQQPGTVPTTTSSTTPKPRRDRSRSAPTPQVKPGDRCLIAGFPEPAVDQLAIGQGRPDRSPTTQPRSTPSSMVDVRT